jgi:hypothetical protein
MTMNPESTGASDRNDDAQPPDTNNCETDDKYTKPCEECRGPSVQDEVEEPGVDEIVEEYLDPDVQSRLWIKAVVPLLQLRSHETDPNGRVQFAFDLMYIAACERIARILHSDLPPSGS